MLTSKLYRDIVKRWNLAADEYNQWDELEWIKEESYDI